MPVSFEVNGKRVTIEVEPRMTLVDCLRHQLRLTGTHVGCEHGVCGACTILLDGEAVRACLILAVQAEGCKVVTVEGLSNDEALTPLQASFRRHHAVQCGFCTPGMITTAHALLTAEPDCDADRVPDGLLHAVILRSSVAHGRIRSIDAAAALRIVGVHAVITARDMPGGPPRIAMRLQPLPEFKPFEQSVIADAEVRYVGEPIAVVLATSIAVGEDALDRIVVDIEPLPDVSDCETSAKGDRLLFAEQGTNCAMTFTAECGDAV